MVLRWDDIARNANTSKMVMLMNLYVVFGDGSKITANTTYWAKRMRSQVNIAHNRPQTSRTNHTLLPKQRLCVSMMAPILGGSTISGHKGTDASSKFSRRINDKTMRIVSQAWKKSNLNRQIRSICWWIDENEAWYHLQRPTRTKQCNSKLSCVPTLHSSLLLHADQWSYHDIYRLSILLDDILLLINDDDEIDDAWPIANMNFRSRGVWHWGVRSDSRLVIIWEEERRGSWLRCWWVETCSIVSNGAQTHIGGRPERKWRHQSQFQSARL